MLKYQRMGGSIPSFLSNDAASCISVAERMIAFCTHGGSVHILDLLGNQVKEFRAHTATVNDLCFDLEGEYIASCSDDGSVVINSLFTGGTEIRLSLPNEGHCCRSILCKKSIQKICCRWFIWPFIF